MPVPERPLRRQRPPRGSRGRDPGAGADPAPLRSARDRASSRSRRTTRSPRPLDSPALAPGQAGQPRTPSCPTSLFAAILVDPKGKALTSAAPAIRSRRSGPRHRARSSAGPSIRRARPGSRSRQLGVGAPRPVRRGRLAEDRAVAPDADHRRRRRSRSRSRGAPTRSWLEASSLARPRTVRSPSSRLDTPPVPKKQPWSVELLQGAVLGSVLGAHQSARDTSRRRSRSPRMIRSSSRYFRKQMDGWLFRPGAQRRPPRRRPGTS